jgi:hypothetical protein
MIQLISQILKTFMKLFPKGKHRNRAILLAMIATIVPLSQLFIIQIFTHAILHGDKSNIGKIIETFALFFGLFAVSHLATYWQKTYRVTVFNDAMKARGGWRSKSTESWVWALSFETNNLVHTFTQVFVLAGFFIWVNWQAGLINLALVFLTLEVIRILFQRQLVTQDEYTLASKLKKPVDNMIKVSTRIKSAEIGTLVANAAFIAALAALLVLSYMNKVNATDAVLLFLGFRMQNTNLAQTSSSLMRFARAKANSSAAHKYRHLKVEDDEEDLE